MITMKPILEPEILEIFNKGRFGEDIEGLIISDGTGCLGHCLWCLDGGLAVILEASVKDPSLLDGAIRAGIAVAQNAGATGFWVEDTTPEMTKWRTIFCKDAAAPIPFETIFTPCCG